MEATRLCNLLAEITCPYREGTDDPNIVPVNVHFFVVGVHKEKAEAKKEEFEELLRTYDDPERLSLGPSYIEAGGVIGDQGAAMVMFAVGKVLGLWDVIIPEDLGCSKEEADMLAGNGMVMMTGWKGAVQHGDAG